MVILYIYNLFPSICIYIKIYTLILIHVNPYQSINTMKGIKIDMVKTTIDIPDEKWKKFSIRVIEKLGGRKKNEVIQELIDKYLAEGDKVKKK